jgi:hypothetical protein
MSINCRQCRFNFLSGQTPSRGILPPGWPENNFSAKLSDRYREDSERTAFGRFRSDDCSIESVALMRDSRNYRTLDTVAVVDQVRLVANCLTQLAEC